MDFAKLSFGKRLRLARVAAGLTQAALAQALGIKQNQISVWEAGTSGPKRDRLPTIASRVGATIDWLMEGRGKPPRGIPAVAGSHSPRRRSRERLKLARDRPAHGDAGDEKRRGA